MTEPFERGVVMISIDTEQIWGYLDCLNQRQFEKRFPDSPDAHTKLLSKLSSAGVSATWFVVGGLALPGTTGLLHCRPFLERLRDERPAQEIGLHGGLTHLIWTDKHCMRNMARNELRAGVEALTEFCRAPRSFSYARNQEAYYELLPAHGIRCFRGRPPSISWRLGRTIPGALLRGLDEVRRAVPPVVWPQRISGVLWSIPASMFLYPIGAARARVIGLRSRVERFSRGVQSAVRRRGIFHFCFHPENLAESPHGFPVLDDMLEELMQARQRGDVEILTMADVLDRIERKQIYVQQKYDAKLLEADWRP